MNTTYQDATYQTLRPFGLEITGIDLRRVEAKWLSDLKLLLARHGVVVLRQQTITDAEFVNFLQRLGPLMFTVGETPVPDQPWLNIVSNVGRASPPRSVFHTDTSYVAQPPAYTALKAVALPMSGGETLFSNQYQAFETLPTEIKVRFAETQVLHVVSGLTLAATQERQCWHPLFRPHPRSGQLALFLSTPERCQALTGLDPEQSQRAIRLLYKHSIRPYRLYRHHWQPADILIWDNRCTMHRADHAQVLGNRVFYRGLVADPVESVSSPD